MDGRSPWLPFIHIEINAAANETRPRFLKHDKFWNITNVPLFTLLGVGKAAVKGAIRGKDSKFLRESPHN